MSGITELLKGMESHNSIFEAEIRNLEIPVCQVFGKMNNLAPVSFKETGETLSTKDTAKVNESFKNSVAASANKVLEASGKNNSPLRDKRVAVLFSGGPAPGGHNVVAGLFKVLGSENTLLGVKAGPKGLLEGNLFEIKESEVERI